MPTSAQTRAANSAERPVELSEHEAVALADSEVVIKAGWLAKRGGRTKTWKKRWFVLRRDRFAYYKDQKEYETRKVVPIDSISGITSSAERPKVLSFYIGVQHVHLRGEEQQEIQHWIKALKSASRLNEMSNAVATSPIDIAKNAIPIPRMPASTTSHSLSAFAVSPASSYAGPVSLPLSRSMPFSDDDLSPAILSEDDYTSPLSAVSTQHEDSHGQANVNSHDTPRHDTEKVIVQGYLRRHQSGALRGSAKIWAVLRPYGLYIYPDHKEYKLSHLVPLSEMVDADELPDSTTPASQGQSKSGRLKFQIITKKKALRFSVDEESLLIEWLGGLKSILERKDKQERPNNV